MKTKRTAESLDVRPAGPRRRTPRRRFARTFRRSGQKKAGVSPLRLSGRRAVRLAGQAVNVDSSQTKTVFILGCGAADGYARSPLVEIQFADRIVVGRAGAVVDDLHAQLRANGVGNPTILKALSLLSGMLGKAELWGYLNRNPVRAVAKPNQRRSHLVRPLPPTTVEALRKLLLDLCRKELEPR